MATDTEVQIKSEHLKKIRAELEQYEVDKANFQKWFSGKEAEANALNAQMNKLRENQIVERKALDKQAKEVKDAQTQLENQRNSIKLELTALDMKAANIAAIETQLQERSFSAKALEVALDEREAALKKRELWVKSIFEAIEKLKD